MYAGVVERWAGDLKHGSSPNSGFGAWLDNVVPLPVAVRPPSLEKKRGLTDWKAGHTCRLREFAGAHVSDRLVLLNRL